MRQPRRWNEILKLQRRLKSPVSNEFSAKNYRAKKEKEKEEKEEEMEKEKKKDESVIFAK